MKKIVLIILFVNCHVNSQNFKFDVDSFLLGMMDDSSGRFIALENEESASYIGSVNSELSELFLDSISKHYNVSKAEIVIKRTSFLHSMIAKKVNEYYIVQIDTNMIYVDKKDKKEYAIYAHELNEKKFDTYDKKMSFLTGMFFQCGKLENNEVVFKTANSSSFDVAVHFISWLGFGYCESARREYNIPNVQIVRFVPSEIHLVYFKILEEKRKNGWK